MATLSKLVVDFKEVDKGDIPTVGGKGANLGEMARANFPVPLGFILTVDSYKKFLFENKLTGKLEEILRSVDQEDPRTLQHASEAVSALFAKATIPSEVQQETIARYRKMGGVFKKALVAVRSSATAEDLPSASFAGQQATFLNVQGETHLMASIKNCWASLFTARAIFYRAQNKIPHKNVFIAVIIQEMVEAEVSGVAFTVDPVTQEKNVMVIEAVWGLGELIVQGAVVPDSYRVSRNTLEIISREYSHQEVELIRVRKETKVRKVAAARQKKRKLTDAQIKEMATVLAKIHTHYYFPQDIEWTFWKKKFYIVQSRPITTLGKGVEVSKSQSKEKTKQSTRPFAHPPILKGIAASPGIGTGRVIKIKSPKELSKVKKGDVLVTVMTSPDYVPAMRKVVAIVTDSGGQTSHAAIVSRELGIPSVVGTKNATAFLTDGLIVTVDGKAGLVYKGGHVAGSAQQMVGKENNYQPPTTSYIPLKTATKLYVNLAEPEKAAQIAVRNVDGVGLLRAEFIMANIGVHPKKALKDGNGPEFTKKLADHLITFCEAFYPRPVVYRSTDFKTNEYRNLKGGEAYEPEESNPLLGFRGAFRYIHDPKVFGLEISALKKVREKGFKNLWLMIPFVRSPQEMFAVKRLIAAAGLLRSPTFKLWLMVELPVNVILLPQFIKTGIDGVSIGSNDLTMLMTGTDRDNETVAESFDERSPAMSWALQHVITLCHKYHVTSSICGQAPSVYDDLVENLVQWGISSISVNPDAIERVREVIYNEEGKIVKRKS